MVSSPAPDGRTKFHRAKRKLRHWPEVEAFAPPTSCRDGPAMRPRFSFKSWSLRSDRIAKFDVMLNKALSVPLWTERLEPGRHVFRHATLNVCSSEASKRLASATSGNSDPSVKPATAAARSTPAASPRPVASYSFANASAAYSSNVRVCWLRAISMARLGQRASSEDGTVRPKALAVL